MMKRHPKALLRKIDIVSGDSAAAQQATAEFKVRSVPAFRVFGPDGALAGSVEGTDLAAVEAAIARIGK